MRSILAFAVRPSYLRPQDVGFMAITFGFLLQWPTLRFIPRSSKGSVARPVNSH